MDESSIQRHHEVKPHKETKLTESSVEEIGTVEIKSAQDNELLVEETEDGVKITEQGYILNEEINKQLAEEELE